MRRVSQETETIKWFDGREKWPDKKREAERIGIKLSQLPKQYHKRAERITACAHQLETRSCPDHEGHYHAIVRAVLCHDRACPVCNWRRSRAYAAKLRDAMGRAGGRYLHLVVTVRNPEDGRLKETRQQITKAFGRMMRDERLRGVVGGYFRALEITRGINGWHPHVHALLRVEDGYFQSALYVHQEEWLQLWRDYYGDQTIEQVHISAIPRDEEGAAVAEVAKYTTKADDLMSLSLDALEEYLEAIKYARLVDTAGCLRVKDENIEAELLHREDEQHEERCPVCGAWLQKYGWVWDEKQRRYRRATYRLSWPISNAEMEELRHRRRTPRIICEPVPV